MKRILSIVDTAYRATLEEQDDTALWFTAACDSAGAEMTVLLTGNAVNYAVTKQHAKSLSFGTAGIPHPPDPEKDLKRMTEKGVNVFLVREDAEERGINPDHFISGIEPINRAAIAKFIDQHDLIWHW